MGYMNTNAVILDPRFKLRIFNSENYVIACSTLKEEFNGVGVYSSCAVAEDDTSIYIAEKEWDRFLAEHL
jgi:hypothetical protein